jgi:hypothetical protein
LISWNTAGASNGTHEVALRIVSAAGNAVTVDDHVVTIAGSAGAKGSVADVQIGPGSPAVIRGAPNGTGASDEANLSAHWVRTRKAAFTSRYGVRNRISGSLTTSAGQPISGALLDVYATPGYQDARTQSLGGVRTGTSGQWTLMLAPGISSCMLRIAYRGHLNDTVPAATATLRLGVHAGIALRITPHVTSVSQKIFFSGVLHGTPIPPGGKQLVLEASSGAEWIQFKTIHTNSHGHYQASYRFKFPGPATYHFRVLSPHESNFPYLNGTSNNITVHER